MKPGIFTWFFIVFVRTFLIHILFILAYIYFNKYEIDNMDKFLVFYLLTYAIFALAIAFNTDVDETEIF